MPEWQINAVREVLSDIGEHRDTPMPPELVVVNKTDAAGDLALARLRHLIPDAVFVSAHTGAGVEELRERIADVLPRPNRELDVLVPYERGELVARIHREGEVLSEEHVEVGTHVHARVNPDLASVLAAYVVDRSTV
jgi:GTP-binding protein HflX